MRVCGEGMNRPFLHCLEFPLNQGHFEQGRFIPDCKQCGKCCEGFWLRADTRDEEDMKFTLLHAGTELKGNIIFTYNPCIKLKDGKCSIHEEDRPEPCRIFGWGDYYHPPGCAFVGGEIDDKMMKGE